MTQPHTRSTLRTLITKASDARRIAEQNLTGIGMIRDKQKRGSTAYEVADQCYQVAKTTFDQQDTLLKQLQEERKQVGGYARNTAKKKGPSKKDLGIAQEYANQIAATSRQDFIQRLAEQRHISVQAAEREIDKYLGLLNGNTEDQGHEQAAPKAG